MNHNPKIGIFLCKCGQKIDPMVDLSHLKKKITSEPGVECCEILPYPCLEPGKDLIIRKIRETGLNRLIIAGCESRLMLKKFERQMEPEGFRKGQIDIVNLRGHVAGVSDLTRAQKAEKGAKLISAAVAEMIALHPSIQQNVVITPPPVIVGGGIATFSAAWELAREGIDCLLSIPEINPDGILTHLHETYPGERANYPRLKTMIANVLASPYVRILPPGELENLAGVTGEYTLSFKVPGDPMVRKHAAGTVIACLDAELTPPGPEFGYDGKTVLCQTDFEDMVWNRKIPEGNTVFWISDYESGQPENAPLSARSAWNIGKHILENSSKSRVVILYNEQMALPVTAAERAIGRRLGLIWVPYDKSVRPILQAGYVNFGSINDHLEHELPWDHLVLSPIRKIGRQSLHTAKVLGIVHEDSDFLGMHHARVRPEMVGREESYLAGSARYACDLNDALNQGRKAGKKNAEMIQKSKTGRLFIPQVVCVVDTDKCVGCGQCQELCDCGGIGVADGSGGGLPRVVDPMVCTGGGTCAAACPYEALTLQNNTNDQREARVAALSRQMADDEFVAFACSWAGLPAADNAGNLGMKYDPRIHIIGVPCLGQLDPSVMARAFLDGTPGLLMVGCSPEDCHHSFGIDHAWSRVNLMKKLFSLCGFDRRRITVAHADLNKPEEFIKTVESFTKVVASLGPIEKTPENQSKLQSIYRLVKSNSRVRLLLSSGLRRPWEKTYRGDQRFALQYDREDFNAALKEEFVKARLENVFMGSGKQSFNIEELKTAIAEEKSHVVSQLSEMVSEGILNIRYKGGKPFYLMSAN